jgi:membrane-associated phospholipid phosphatase
MLIYIYLNMKHKIQLTLISLFFVTGLSAQNLDLRLLESINGPVNPGPDRAWRDLTNTANYIDAAIPISLAVTGFIENDQSLKIKAYDIGASLLISGGAGLVIKDVVKRERPYYAHPNLIFAKVKETDYSFPSGHASLAFATATSLSLAVPKWYVIAPSFLYAGAVGYSRMYLGAHYPSDVLGGAVLGVASSYLTFKLQKMLDRKYKHPVY